MCKTDEKTCGLAELKKPEETRSSMAELDTWKKEKHSKKVDTGFRTFPRRALGIPTKRSRGIAQPFPKTNMIADAAKTVSTEEEQEKNTTLKNTTRAR